MTEHEATAPAFLQRRPTRRGLLRAAALGAAGVSAAALLGCGGDDESTANSGGSGADSSVSTNISTTGQRPDKLPAGWVWASDSPYPTDFPEPAGKAAKPGGIFNVAVSWDVGPFDPVSAAAGGSITVPNTVYNRLVGFATGPGVDTTTLKLEPELAASWERSPDGLTITFKIAPGAKWQNVPPLNGRPFVAADAKFAFERYQKEGVYKSYWTGVSSIDAPDASTLRIKLTKPLVDFINPLASRYQTIFPHELVDDGSIGKAVVGTGPFIFKEAITGQRVTLTKNPDYFETKVLLDGVEFRPMPDAAARLAAFRSGQIEFAYSMVNTKRQMDEVVKTNPDIQVTSLASSTASGPQPMFNHQNPRWQDVRVRRAVSLATDRQAISKLVFEGIGQTVSVLPWRFVYDDAPSIESGKFGNWARYAPDEAKQLLRAAGQENLTIDARYYEYSTTDTQVAEVMADQFRQVGITYSVKKLDYTEFNSQLIGGTFPDVLHNGYMPLGTEADTYFYNGLHSKSPGNRDHVNDSQIDTWAEAQQIELDPAKRKDLLTKIWTQYHDQAYRPVRTFGRAFNVQQPWVRGVRLESAFGARSYFYDWGEILVKAWLDK
ncbi:MAG: ABC transporter substrate-binding protein [Dehalococcoidia bacterium]|nr:ABC transporter substrate-binding protein [Dehalococcoidia bacterium]